MIDDIATDNIIFKTVWQDCYMIEIEATCISSVALATTNIYVTDELIDKLIYKIGQVLDGSAEESVWENESRGNDTVACLSLRFFKKDRQGHFIIEVFAELQDGGEYEKHNCCFYVNTEYGLLMNFCNRLERLKQREIGYIIELNCYM